MHTRQIDDVLVAAALPRPNRRHCSRRPLGPKVDSAQIVVSHDSIVPAEVRELSESIDRISHMINNLMERRESLIDARHELIEKAGGFRMERAMA